MLWFEHFLHRLVAYFNLPDDSTLDMNFLHVKPFSKGTWLAVFLILVLLFLVHYAMSGEIINSWLYIISCLTMQGIQLQFMMIGILSSTIATTSMSDNDISIKGYSGGVRNSIRIVTFIGALLFVILFALYSGELISSLSTKTEKVYTANDLM